MPWNCSFLAPVLSSKHKTFFSLHLRSPATKCGEGNGTRLQYSCLENPMDGGAWKAAVHGVAEGRTRLSDFTFTFHFHALEKEMATHSSVLAWRIPWGLTRTWLKRLSSRSSSSYQMTVVWVCSKFFPNIQDCHSLLTSPLYLNYNTPGP